MSLAACLLLYSIAVCLIGPPMLRQLTRAGHAPRCGVAAWLVAVASVLISWFAAALLTVAELLTGGGHHTGVLASCFAFVCDVVFGHAGRIPQILLLAAAAGGVMAVSVATVRLVKGFVGLRVRTREHAEAVRLVGHSASDDGVFVVDSSERVAYCVSGRPPVIVVTTGTLAALDADQLDAVLAHERAHLTGRHHLVLAALHSVATVFPKLTLMTQGATEVSRMLEMCADDAAARRFGRDTLLSGLMSLAGVAAPAGAMGAAGVATLSRAERLAVPATPPMRIRARAALISASTMIAGGPLVTFTLMATGTLVC
ncbi:M56 family metallopeptidase [Mycolicibacterium fallax]|uniref:Peptidase M48 n=1 Tax=Mycolicibacterium fallax TaxID=1793 RepID=A0A1X1R367_MYCFA|nr:M56 family metallopeptidase [Mycolicibacterium fallax]ORU98659.1 peptidase M48 [Mycolicibacterium fallax]BBY99866.1 hypothetical protein MFAL_33330 [Mycolicibacterium fallax]